MIRHIVMWNLKGNLDLEDKQRSAKKIKEGLEALKNIVEGVIDINVIIDPMESSNVDIMLDSTFIDEEALNAYQVHPQHKKIATFVKEKVCSRYCMDFEE